jgi:hypothetical protein
MTDRDNFLLRWSRRKRAAAQADGAPAPDAAQAAEAEKSLPLPEDSAAPEPGETRGVPGPAAPAFDPASLPPIESITAATDIRAFLAAGVPAELTRAALRRVWTSDPKIRDFVGLADYDWDFNAPGSMPGFGPIETADALSGKVAIPAGRPATEDRAPAASHRNAEVTRTGPGPEASDADRSLNPLPSKEGPSPGFDDPEKGVGDNRVAAQRQEEDSKDVPIARRKHGGALPQS